MLRCEILIPDGALCTGPDMRRTMRGECLHWVKFDLQLDGEPRMHSSNGRRRMLGDSRRQKFA